MLFRSSIKAALALASVSSLLGSCEAQLNETCVTETAEIHSAQTVVDATMAIIEGTLDLQDPATCGGSGDTLTCSYDFGKAESNFNEVCGTAGGQVIDTSFEIKCDVSAPSGSSGQVTYVFTNIPECVGMACDATKLDDQLKNTTGELAIMLDKIPALSNCGSTTAMSASAPAVGATALLVASSALLASTMLFF